MIKFFRHIRKSLLMENKTGSAGHSNRSGKYVKYAIGEVALVMIGILLALQVNNWNETRKEQVMELEYLDRLQGDITNDLQMYILNIEFYSKVFDYGNFALSYTDGDKLENISNWKILVSFFHASQIWPIIPTASTYEELKSSGELSLIRSVDLRNNMAYFYGGGLERYNHTIGIQPPYRKMVRGLIPIKIQNYLWENCHETAKDTQILKDCDPNINEEEIISILDELTNNSVLLEELRYYMSSIRVGLSTVREQRNLCKSMLDEINEIQNK